MAKAPKTPFSLPADFVDNPTEASLPRQLIIYDEDSNTWNPTTDKDTIADTRYLCVSYRQSDFSVADRRQLEQDVQAVCQKYDLLAYWLDYACTGKSQEEKNRDLYRIADVFRGAAKTLIMIKGNDYKMQSPGWRSWGDRLWTLPEALLSGYRDNTLVYKAGTRPVKPITLREIANHAYKDGDKEMALMNAYSGEPVISSYNMFATLVKTVWSRSSGPGEGAKKAGAFTAYDAEKVYAIMGFMPVRILPDPNESEEEAFKRLMKKNRFNMDLSTILNSSDEDTFLNEPMAPSLDSTQAKILDTIPYTGGMRYDKGKCCLEGTRRNFLEKIKLYIDNSSGLYSDKRIFLLTGVAGSGKSTIANSIASHYDTLVLLGSSFFFSEANKESSKAYNLFRNMARDLADNNKEFRAKLCSAVANNTSLRTTISIQEQFQQFIDGIIRNIALEHPIVVVIDALDECSKGDNRLELLDILAKGLSATPNNFRLFVTARPVSDITVFDSSKYVEHLTMDEIHSNRDDIKAFFLHQLSQVAEELSTVNSKWLTELTDMAGNLFIYADVTCRYILKKEFRRPKEKLQNILSLQEEADLNSPIPYLYKLYTKVLDNVIDVEDLSPKNLADVRERLVRVLAMVLLAYEPLSSSDIDELLGPNDNATGIVEQMGTLLNGVSNPAAPVHLLHASFGDFLRDEKHNKAFYINPQRQHAEIAKKCLEVMNKSLKFNIFKSNDVSVPKDLEQLSDLSGDALSDLSGQELSDLSNKDDKDDEELSDLSDEADDEPSNEDDEDDDEHSDKMDDSIPQEDEDETPDEDDGGISKLSTRIRKALKYSCQYWPAHITQTSKDDFWLIQKPLQRFLYEGKHLMQWIEVISVTKQTREACDALISLYNWLKETIPKEERTAKLIWECYHLLRCFEEPIALGPLQAYLSALPYAPSESLLHKLYKNQSILPLNICFGRIHDIRLYFPKILSLETLDILEYKSFAAIAFSSNGTQIAAVSRQLEILDFATFSRISPLMELDFRSDTVAFSPDGSKIAVAGAKRCAVWSLTENQIIIQESFTGADSEILAVAFPTNDRLFFCIRFRENLKFMDLTLPHNGVEASRHGFQVGKNIICATLSPNAKFLGNISLSNKVSIWDLNNRKSVADDVVLGDGEGAFDVLSVSNDGEYVACGSDEGTVKLWSSRTASFVWSGMVDYPINRILMPSSGEMECLVTVSGGSAIHVWNTQSGSCYRHEAAAKEGFAAMSPDGKYIVTPAYEGELKVWAIAAEKGEPGTNGSNILPGETLEEVVFLQDGSLIANGIGAGRGEVIIWDDFGTANLSKQTLQGHTSGVSSARFSPDGMKLVSKGQEDVILWCRENDGNFVLEEKHEYEDFDDGKAIFDKLIQNWKSEIDSDDSQSQDGSNVEESDAIVTYKHQWVRSGKTGRRLLYIPEGFSDSTWERARSIRQGSKIVVYSPRFAVLFEYEDDILSTIT